MHSTQQYFVLYDNLCLFCNKSRKLIQAFDWLHKIKLIPIYDIEELAASGLPIPPQATLAKELHLINHKGAILTGFYACRKIGILLPLTFPFAIFLYIPGVHIPGKIIYRLIAENK